MIRKTAGASVYATRAVTQCINGRELIDVFVSSTPVLLFVFRTFRFVCPALPGFRHLNQDGPIFLAHATRNTTAVCRVLTVGVRMFHLPFLAQFRFGETTRLIWNCVHRKHHCDYAGDLGTKDGDKI